MHSNTGSKQDSAFSVKDHELLGQVAAQHGDRPGDAKAEREMNKLKTSWRERKTSISKTRFRASCISKRSWARAYVVTGTEPGCDGRDRRGDSTCSGRDWNWQRADCACDSQDEPAKTKQLHQTRAVAAIPTGLLESELFGHRGEERAQAREARWGGSRGGALSGEIGDIPPETQPKVLPCFAGRPGI